MAMSWDRIVLELEPDQESLTGRVYRDGQPARQFTGWLGLIAALQALLPEQGVDEGELSPPSPGGTAPDGRRSS